MKIRVKKHYRFLSKFKNKINLGTCIYKIYLEKHISEY